MLLVGQQVDRAEVFAILPGDELKSLAQIAFGNCVDCVDGFVLIDNGEVIVDGVMDVNTMDLWIQSQGQPPFTLTGNLQTLSGVGRLSGQVPFCAIGIRIEYSVFSDPANSSTEFSTHILCPEPSIDCSFEPSATPNCLADGIFCVANLPAGCFSDDATILWYNQNGNLAEGQEALIPLTGNEGMLYLEVQDGCCTIVDSFLIENPAFAEAGPDLTACQGEMIELAGSGGMGHFWEYPDGSTNADSILTIPSASSTFEGWYFLHAFNEEGCEDIDSLYITVEMPPNPVLSFIELCLGDTLFLSLENESDYASFEWTNPQGVPVPNGVVFDFQSSDEGAYTLIATTASGCQIINAFEISANSLPGLDYVIEESCDSATIYLIPDTLSYAWNNGETGSILATATGGGFMVTVTDSEGCQSVENIVIPMPNGPEVNLAVDQPICPGEYGALDILLHSEERIAIFSIDGGQTFSVNNRFDELLPGAYDVVIMDDMDCTQEFDFEIIAPDTMGVALNYDPLDVRPNTEIELVATTVGVIVSYQWLPNEIDSGQESTSFTATNNMDIRIIVKDAKGCNATASLPLTVSLGDIYVPNAISPNGDGRNDAFTFYSDNGSGEIIERLQVYDRWGGLIFDASEIPLNTESVGWDGTRKGEKMNTGIYTYYGIVRFGNGVKRLFEGDIQIVR